jgi:multidrug efflux pump subunit AcrA (membrane-fusion protein)
MSHPDTGALLAALAAGLRQLQAFRGAPTEFWQIWTRTAGEAMGAELGVLYVGATGEPGSDPERWQAVSSWPQVPLDALPALADTVPSSGIETALSGAIDCVPSLAGNWRVGLVSVALESEGRPLLLALHLPQASPDETLVRSGLQALRLVPRLYEMDRRQRAGARESTRLQETLETVGRVVQSQGFDQAALAMVNDLAERFGCETVSFSWWAREGLRLRAISHADKVERRSELTSLLEEAGQEALLQAREIDWPTSDPRQVVLAHARYATLQQPGQMLTLPLARGEVRLGAISLERQRMAFTRSEKWALRLFADLLLPVLELFELQSRPLWRRLGAEIARSLPSSLKPSTPEGRQFSRALLVGALLLLLVPLPYSIDAGAQVKTDAMAYAGAPFDGYLESSSVSLGVKVRKGDALFTMATRELSLERASILADVAQYAREAEKRRAAGQLPEMQIAEAQVAQSQSRLEQVDYKLGNAEVKATLDGVVVEGEPGKNLGGALRRGETIMKIAALEGMHVEAAVAERDVTQVAVKGEARLTLLAKPGETYVMKVARIIPAASVKDGENAFPVRLEHVDPIPDWWRPGMSGVVKIDAGWRPLAWLMTHRLIDYLRLILWV